MNYHTDILKQDLLQNWEAWVDIQKESVKPFTIYVIGEIFWKNDVIKPTLVKKSKGATENGILELELRPAIMWNTGAVEEVIFSEELNTEDHYKEVLVFAGNELLIHQKSIDKVY